MKKMLSYFVIVLFLAVVFEGHKQSENITGQTEVDEIDANSYYRGKSKFEIYKMAQEEFFKGIPDKNYTQEELKRDLSFEELGLKDQLKVIAWEAGDTEDDQRFIELLKKHNLYERHQRVDEKLSRSIKIRCLSY